MIRLLHANGASLFFALMYTHIGRGLYYGSFLNRGAWGVGVILFLVRMAVAFIGYVLPWGQMSFWGARVITNLFSAVPYVGADLVRLMLGGYGVCGATLQRFFVLHFFLPFVLVFLRAVHLLFLHHIGGRNPLGVRADGLAVPFHPYYT